MKYKKIIDLLDEDTIYTPASIAYFAEDQGLLKSNTPKPIKAEKHRIRISMGRFSNNHKFPDHGDGMVTLPGQAPTPGWFGWRWMAAYE